MTRNPIFSFVKNPHHADILSSDLSSILEKKVIREVGMGFSPTISWSSSRMGVFVLSPTLATTAGTTGDKMFLPPEVWNVDDPQSKAGYQYRTEVFYHLKDAYFDMAQALAFPKVWLQGQNF